MAKRKAGSGLPRSSSSKSPVETAVRKFEIPPLLKTEPIYVEPAIYDEPCPLFKMQTIPGVDERNILLKCDGCGISGSCLLGSGYKIVKTVVLAEVGTQTGFDEIKLDTVKM